MIDFNMDGLVFPQLSARLWGLWRLFSMNEAAKDDVFRNSEAI